MRYSMLLAAVLASVTFASCAHPLEQIVEANHQKRVGEAYAGRPITAGAGDGIGAYAQNRLTMSDKPAK